MAVLYTAAANAAVVAQLDRRQDTDTCVIMCPDVGGSGETTYFSDPCSSTCNSYYECSAGVLFNLACPQGLAWNQDLQLCDSLENIGECPPVPDCCNAPEELPSSEDVPSPEENSTPSEDSPPTEEFYPSEE